MANDKDLAAIIPFSQLCNIEEKVELESREELQALPIFFRLNERERGIIASITQRKCFLKDDIIYTQDQPGARLFILSKGEVKITRLIRERRNQTLALLKSGAIFGEETLICGDEHTTSAVCTADSEIFVIKKDDFDRMARENPQLGTKILKFMTLSLCSDLRKINAKICHMVDYVTSASTD